MRFICSICSNPVNTKRGNHLAGTDICSTSSPSVPATRLPLTPEYRMTRWRRRRPDLPSTHLPAAPADHPPSNKLLGPAARSDQPGQVHVSPASTGAAPAGERVPAFQESGQGVYPDHGRIISRLAQPPGASPNRRPSRGATGLPGTRLGRAR